MKYVLLGFKNENETKLFKINRIRSLDGIQINYEIKNKYGAPKDDTV